MLLVGPHAPPEIHLIRELQKLMFREADIGSGAMHFGAFMFRDMFGRFSVPVGFGRFSLKPLEEIDFSESQIRWLCSDEETLFSYEDQYFDVCDIASGAHELGSDQPLPDQASHLVRLAHFNLEASAGALCRAYGYVGSTQSALLAVELSLKAALLARGTSESELKKSYGHNLGKLASEFASHNSGFDGALVGAVIDRLPAYVPNRYDPEQPSRVESGHIVMGAQFIVSEVIRAIGFATLGERRK
jgi:hypothetical protein